MRADAATVAAKQITRSTKKGQNEEINVRGPFFPSHAKETFILFAALFSAFPLHVSHGMRSFLYVTHENLFIAVCLLVVSLLYRVFFKED